MHHDQIMESYTPLNNYLSNYVIKLHIKLQALFYSFFFHKHRWYPLDFMWKIILQVSWEILKNNSGHRLRVFPKYVGHLFQEWGTYSTPHFMYNDESFEGS